MMRMLLFIDLLSSWVGKCFGWLILVLTLAVSYEVFMRYLLNSPTTWAFDISYITYGALFLMAGAYTLSRNGHVRADVLYRLWPPKVQASVDLLLYIIFFFPAVIAFVWAGWNFARMSVMFKGIADVIRCIICIRSGAWPQRLHDVEEMETAILAEQQYQREHAGENAASGKGA